MTIVRPPGSCISSLTCENSFRDFPYLYLPNLKAYNQSLLTSAVQLFPPMGPVLLYSKHILYQKNVCVYMKKIYIGKEMINSNYGTLEKSL